MDREQTGGVAGEGRYNPFPPLFHMICRQLLFRTSPRTFTITTPTSRGFSATPTSPIFPSVPRLPLGHFTDCFMLAQRAAFPRGYYLAAFIKSSIIASSRGQRETDFSCERILLASLDYFAADSHAGYVFMETVILSLVNVDLSTALVAVNVANHEIKTFSPGVMQQHAVSHVCNLQQRIHRGKALSTSR